MSKLSRSQPVTASSLNVQVLQSAIAFHQSGNLPQAEALYQQILHTDPNHADALHLLGLIEHQQGQSAQALARIRLAISLQSANAMFHFNLANMLFELGQMDEATVHFQQAVQLEPASVDALLGLAMAYRTQNRLDECLGTYRQVAKLAPGFAPAHRSLGQVLLLLGRPEEAEPCFRRCLAWQADDVQASIGLGGALSLQGKLDEAAKRFESVCARAPDHADAFLGLANVRKAQDRLDEAVQAGRRALALQPNLDAAYINLANTFLLLGQLDDAVQTLQQALTLESGRAPEIHSNLLFIYQLQSERSAAQVFAEHGAYAARFEAPFKAHWPAHGNARNPSRKLKIGYVSGDFCAHVVAYFIEPILALHDKAQFEIYAYYSYAQHDEHTLRPRVSLLDYLALHQRIDLALDPFPYNGGTTTMHALWMGVPVVTLEGDHAVSHLSAAHLSRVNLTQFVSRTEEEYLQCVLHAVHDLPELNRIRQSLRQRMTTGECDPAVITRHLEAAYQDMWRTWCSRT